MIVVTLEVNEMPRERSTWAVVGGPNPVDLDFRALGSILGGKSSKARLSHLGSTCTGELGQKQIKNIEKE